MGTHTHAHTHMATRDCTHAHGHAWRCLPCRVHGSVAPRPRRRGTGGSLLPSEPPHDDPCCCGAAGPDASPALGLLGHFPLAWARAELGGSGHTSGGPHSPQSLPRNPGEDAPGAGVCVCMAGSCAAGSPHPHLRPSRLGHPPRAVPASPPCPRSRLTSGGLADHRMPVGLSWVCGDTWADPSASRSCDTEQGGDHSDLASLLRGQGPPARAAGRRTS